MPTKHERVVVHRHDGRSSGGANVSKDSFAGSIGTDTAEVRVMERWLGVFVEGGMLSGVPISIEILSSWRIPCYAKTINIKETVACGNLVFCGYFIWVMGKKLGQVMLVNLFSQPVSLHVEVQKWPSYVSWSRGSNGRVSMERTGLIRTSSNKHSSPSET